MKKTEEELLDLKDQWQKDPIWDIEDTEGFEEYKEELLEWRLEQEKQIDREFDFKIKAIQNHLQCNYQTAEYLYNVEKRLRMLENKYPI